jgi:integrase
VKVATAHLYFFSRSCTVFLWFFVHLFHDCFTKKQTTVPTFKISVQKHQQRRDGKFPVSIRMTHNRQSAYMKTDTYVTRKQVASDLTSIKDTEIVRLIDRDIIEYEKRLLRGLGSDLSAYTARELVDYLQKHIATDGGANIDFITFSRDHIANLRAAKRDGTAMRLEAVVNRLVDYFGRPSATVKEINVKNMREFAEYLQKPHVVRLTNKKGETVKIEKSGVIAQTAKDYLADVQTLFNAACEKYNDEDAEIALITHRPFSSKKLQIEVKEEPKKRDLPVEDLVKILWADNLPGRRMQLARDVLVLSFGLVAMNTADLFGDDARLDFRRITYHRQKTKARRKDEALMSVKIEPEIISLLRKYRDPDKKRLFLFYKMYANFREFNRNINQGCKQLATHLGINPQLSTYYMRHSWATIAAEDCRIAEGDIAFALTHVSADDGLGKNINHRVTRGYIHRRFSRIDGMNRQVLDFVAGKQSATGSVLAEKTP